MKQTIAAVIITLFLASAAIAGDAPKSSAQSREPWCKPGWVCLRTEEVAADASYHYDLQEKILQYKRRAARFGLTVGPGIGVGSVITSEYDVHWIGTTGVFVIWGLRF